MHRNTFIFIVLLAIFTAIVVGVNLGRSSQPSQSLNPITTPTPEPFPTQVLLKYTNSLCGVSFSYPDTYTTIEIATGGVTLVNKQQTSTSIILVCQKDIPRVPLTEDKIEKRQIGSASANLYHDASEQDGTPLDKVIFTHPKTKKDVYIAGFGKDFDNLINTLNLYP